MKKIKKQTILLVITLIFALIFTGTVSAADPSVDGTDQLQMQNLTSNSLLYSNSSTSNNPEEPVDPEITLNITLEHPEALSGDRLPTVTVTDNNGNTIDDVTITKTDNTIYRVNFTSSKTSFNLNVSALGHVPQTTTVQVSKRNSTDPILYGQANLTLRAYNLLILSGCPNYSKPIVTSNQKLREEGYYFNLNFFTNTEMISGDTTIESKIKQMSTRADLIIIEMISEVETVAKLRELIEGTNAKIMALRCGVAFLNDPIIDSNDTELRTYWDGTGEENMGRFQLKALQQVGMAVDSNKDLSAINWPTGFIYHPDSETPMFTSWEDYQNWYIQSGHYQNDGAWVGILAYASTFMNGNSEMQQQILRSLEAKGLNVILAICKGDADRVNAIKNYFMDGNTTRISALVACVGYNIVYSKPDESTKLLENLNVPIFAPIYSSDLEKWETSSSELSSEISWQVAWPEMEGRIEPIMMGGVTSSETDSYTGINIQRYTPLTDRIERITNRVVNWVKLQKLSNEEKKIALIYYNTQGGKDGVGASYLNVPESISEILKALKKEGYSIPDEYSVESIIKLLTTAGNNVGSWAPGELKKVVEAGAITIPLDEYMEWFNSLPEELQQEVTGQWGPAPGNVMVYEGEIVLPGVMLGNLFLGAQPMRGWGEDSTDIAHSTTLPPTHQYIAFYMWLQKELEANAVIHLGTHGTLEWLPGRSLGLGEDDWPDVLLGDMPDIYPYIVDNTGEGTQAKRRGYAVIIDHLTAPIIASGLYGDLAELQDLINSYDNTDNQERKEVLQREILTRVNELHLDTDLSLDLETTPFQSIKNSVEHHLEELAATLMPYGLHTFGVALSGEVLDQMVESIVSFDPENRDNTEFREMIRDLLSQNHEMESLLAALNGEYISPSLGGDPIRRADDVLPTGMNFYSFDPRAAPDKTAWEIGKKMADDLLEAYYAENGCYPETVGVVLWSTETMRTVGQSVAMTLRYMGLEPVWDKSGRFTGVNVTSLEDLKRPRVDVLMTISGLFRDTFGYTINILDTASRQVANLSESTDDNYVRKHYLKDMDEYLQSGMNSNDAETLAGARIFGEAPGSYGTGVAAQVPSTTKWDDQSDLVDTYLSRMSYIYGSGVYGISGLDAFKNQLQNVDATIQVRDNNYGILDNDDVYQYLGGLTMTAKSISNQNVDVYIANTRTNPKVETLGQFMSTEMRTRILNPKWTEGMLNEGFSGANEISHELGYLFAWNAVTPGAVQEWMWQAAVETYIFDPETSSKFTQANAYAYTSAAAWALEAVRRGMWTPDSATLTQLADAYISSTVQYGVTCCHHTCGNLAFNNFVVMSSSLSSDQLQQFAAGILTATGKTVTVGATGETPQSDGSTSTSGSSASQDTSQAGDTQDSTTSQSAGSDGSSKAHEITQTSSGSSSSSNTPMIAIIGVICLLCLIGVGYFRGSIMDLLKK